MKKLVIAFAFLSAPSAVNAAKQRPPIIIKCSPNGVCYEYTKPWRSARPIAHLNTIAEGGVA